MTNTSIRNIATQALTDLLLSVGISSVTELLQADKETVMDLPRMGPDRYAKLIDRAMSVNGLAQTSVTLRDIFTRIEEVILADTKVHQLIITDPSAPIIFEQDSDGAFSIYTKGWKG